MKKSKPKIDAEFVMYELESAMGTIFDNCRTRCAGQGTLAVDDMNALCRKLEKKRHA